MRTRSRVAIVAIAAVLLCPALAHAAENGDAGGSWTALIFYIVNFGLFIWLIKRFGGAQISGFFRNRAATIRRNMSGAETALRDAEALAQKAAALIANLAAEKTRIGAELTDETTYQIKQIDEAARESVARIQRDIQVSAEALRDAGQRHLREALASAAARLAEEIVRREFQPGDQSRLIDTFAGKLGEEAPR